MRPEYNGVKFYSRYDLSVGWELEKAEPIILSVSESEIPESVNKIIELYNIQELIETGIILTS